MGSPSKSLLSGPSKNAATLIYLLSHDRPMSEVLAPTRKDITDEYLHNFEGMTNRPVSRKELIAARETLISSIVEDMPDEHRQFLIAFERGQPDWSLLDVAGVADLPAVKWRQQNLDRIKKREARATRSTLGGSSARDRNVSYDFSSLSHPDFESRCLDLVGAHAGLRFEAFSPGPDGGIDGRHAKASEMTVLQVKHYRGS